MCLTPLLQCMLSSSAGLWLAYFGVAARLHRKSPGHGNNVPNYRNNNHLNIMLTVTYVYIVCLTWFSPIKDCRLWGTTQTVWHK